MQTKGEMTIEEACHSILGGEVAHAIITEQSLEWAIVAAMAAARTSHPPEAIAAIKLHIARAKGLPS